MLRYTVPYTVTHTANLIKKSLECDPGILLFPIRSAALIAFQVSDDFVAETYKVAVKDDSYNRSDYTSYCSSSHKTVDDFMRSAVMQVFRLTRQIHVAGLESPRNDS